MNKVLVIGGSGFMGSHTADLLSDNGYVVTILTIKYWQNLSKRYLRRNKKVTKIDLLAAIRVGDPSNRILKNTPIIGNRIINFKVIVKYKSDNNWPYKFIKAGSIDSDILYEKSSFTYFFSNCSLWWWRRW